MQYLYRFIFVLIISVFLNTGFANSINTVDSLKMQIKTDITSLKNNKANPELFKRIGANYQRISNFDSALYFYKEGLKLVENQENKILQSSISYNISLIYLKLGQYQKALAHAQSALQLDRESNNSENIAASLNSLALIYQEWGSYDKALEYRLESIKFSEENNNPIEIANGYYNLGSIYVKLNKIDKALKSFTQAQDKFEELLNINPTNLELKQGLSECVYSIGGIHLHKQEYQKAQDLFLEALSIKQITNDKIGIGNCYYQIGLSNFLQNNYEISIQHLFKALQYKILADDKKGIALTYFRIGNLYFNQNQFTKSESFLQKSILTAKTINDKEVLRESYKILYQIYSKKKLFKQALSYHKLYKAYTDSTLSEQTTKIVEELNIRFETDKKEQENRILQQDNQIQTLTIRKQKELGFYLIGGIVLALSILIVIYLLYRSKRRANKIISQKNTLLEGQNLKIASQKKEIEEKNLSLTDSIQYAKRIQESMLSDVKHLNNVLADAFILFKPKDIVSGDFYWFGQKDNKFVIAAIDCTGHGVPGAFMSMLGNTFLNRIVLDKGITEPENILQELSKEVKLALKQEETENRDGMDMALCTLNLDTKEVEFSGAKNPLIHIHNGIAERIKGDKKPIGYSHYGNTPFEKHTIQPSLPRYFYMFSDGYQDQFGGPKNKKFMIKRFQELLIQIHKNPMNKQKEILDKTIEDWMKNEEQVDDILVVGFKID